MFAPAMCALEPALEAGTPQSAQDRPRPLVVSWARRVREAPARSRRVGILLFAVTLISLADLDMTLAYASSGGMAEANPLARLLLSYGSSASLAAWKLGSVMLCVWILFRTRTRRSAEVAAWVCFAVLVWLSFRWRTYNEQQMPPVPGRVVVTPADDTVVPFLEE